MKYFQINQIIKISFLSILLNVPLFGQGISTRLPEIPHPGNDQTLSNSILNPSRFQIQQGITFTTFSGNGFSRSAGIYSNYMSYKVSDKLDIQTGIHLISASGSKMFGVESKPNIDFDMELNYHPSENLQFKLGFARITSGNLYYQHNMNRNLYLP